MIREINRICTDAVAGKRRVFVVLGSNAPSWCKIFLDSKKFRWHTVEEWSDPVRMSAEASRTLAAIGTMARSGSGKWMIVEVTVDSSSPAATQPATAPSQTVAEIAMDSQAPGL
jgi:hypothetical protein